MKKAEIQTVVDNVTGSFEQAGFRVAALSSKEIEGYITVDLLLNEETNTTIVVYEDKVFLNDNLAGIQLLGDTDSDFLVKNIQELLK
jgi:hypothetical protein